MPFYLGEELIKKVHDIKRIYVGEELHYGVDPSECEMLLGGYDYSGNNNTARIFCEVEFTPARRVEFQYAISGSGLSSVEPTSIPIDTHEEVYIIYVQWDDTGIEEINENDSVYIFIIDYSERTILLQREFK